MLPLIASAVSPKITRRLASIPAASNTSFAFFIHSFNHRRLDKDRPTQFSTFGKSLGTIILLP